MATFALEQLDSDGQPTGWYVQDIADHAFGLLAHRWTQETTTALKYSDRTSAEQAADEFGKVPGNHRPKVVELP